MRRKTQKPVRKRKPGRPRLSIDEHRRRGTFQACRHGERDQSTGDQRPVLHSYRGHCLVAADLPEAVGRAVIYTLRTESNLTWDDMPALIARLTKELTWRR
jgi:hypothetical protein